MKVVEVNERGNFDNWDPKWVKELAAKNHNTALGQYLFFESDHVKLWELMLLPKERLSFRKQQCPYVWICETGGMAISRWVNGQIFLLHFDKDDTSYFEPNEHNYIRDLENIGDRPLKMTLIEFAKKTETLNIPI